MNDTPDSMLQISFLGKEVLDKLTEACDIIDVPSGIDILKEGQHVRTVPVVLSGLVKVFTKQDDKELLLYYIRPSESCVMSFSAGLNNGLSKVYAKTEEDSSLLLLPSPNLARWISDYPSLNRLFYNQFDTRYTDLLETIEQLLFDKLDKRLLHYLKEKMLVTGRNIISISHRDIANDLGSAREVITRVLKKLEKDRKIVQQKDGIEILSGGDQDHHF